MATLGVQLHNTDFRDWRNCVLERMRVVIVAGIAVGFLFAGVVSRLAMLLLRLTSPDRVIGIESDDGFTIGQVTLSGTYNLLLLGAFTGIAGVGAYRLVAPWLIGPLWFRRLTTGLGAGIVVGSMLIHSDGVDFRVLKPTWLAIGLFIVVPGLFGVLIGPVVDAVGRPDSWTRTGWRRWGLPVIALALFPFTLIAVGFALVLVSVWALARDVDFPAAVRSVRWLPNVVRGGFLAIVVLALNALLDTVSALV